jgi:hypothetical protein
LNRLPLGSKAAEARRIETAGAFAEETALAYVYYVGRKNLFQ